MREIITLEQVGTELKKLNEAIAESQRKLSDESETYKDLQYLSDILGIVEESTSLNGEGFEVRNADFEEVKKHINELKVMK